jgi:hypothetical protein
MPPVPRIPVHAFVPLRAPRLPGIELFSFLVVEPRRSPRGIVIQVKLPLAIERGQPTIEAESLPGSGRSLSLRNGPRQSWSGNRNDKKSEEQNAGKSHGGILRRAWRSNEKGDFGYKLSRVVPQTSWRSHACEKKLGKELQPD